MSENRLDRKKGDKRKQKVNGEKQVEKIEGEYLAKSNARGKYKDVQENRLKRGHQQTEAIYKGSKKEEEVSRVLSGFHLTLRPGKSKNLFFTNRRLILASFFNSTDRVSVKQ